MTLVEIMVAMTIIVFVMSTVFYSFLLARRLSEAAIFNESTNSIVQGYIEQIKNMDYASVNISATAGTSTTSSSYSTSSANKILTMLDEATADTIVLSPLPVVNPATLTASTGTGPVGYYPNVKTFTVSRASDLTITLWLWVEDKTPSSSGTTQQIKGLTLIYLSSYFDGSRTRHAIGSVHSMRSLVPTY
jgi:type II secretory pathway pseudopilin PulG